MQMIAATNNDHKLKEIKAILTGTGFSVISLKEADIDIDIEENGQTFLENALIKARAIAKLTGQASVADDSGLEVEALGGAPGVHSARFSGVTGPGKDVANNEKLKSSLKDVPPENRKARFCCAIAAVLPDGREITAEGYVYGIIGYEESGYNGFGYDPLFVVDGFAGKTMAELGADTKNQISHRANALKAFMAKMQKLEPISPNNFS